MYKTLIQCHNREAYNSPGYALGMTQEQSIANADLIVRAVNNHADLLEALELMLKVSNDRLDGKPINASEHARAFRLTEQAIAKAKGQGITV